MTGFNTGGLPISRVTVASLDDLGYTVSYAAADPFPASALGPCRCNNIEVEVPRESGKLDAMTTITQENVGREDDTKDDEVVHEEGPRESVKLDAEDNVGGEEAGQEVAEKKRFRIGGGTTKKIDNNAHGRTRGKTTGRVTGTGRVGGKRRKLSHEGRQVAINYGKSELRKRKAMRASMPPEQKSRYIGDLFISVIYMEEGEVYTVEVWGDDV